MNGDIRINPSKKKSKEVCNTSEWRALDSTPHPWMKDDATVEQEGNQESSNLQVSEEQIIIKDSCDIEVRTTDT
jgi:spore coat protein X